MVMVLGQQQCHVMPADFYSPDLLMESQPALYDNPDITASIYYILIINFYLYETISQNPDDQAK